MSRYKDLRKKGTCNCVPFFIAVVLFSQVCNMRNLLLGILYFSLGGLSAQKVYTQLQDALKNPAAVTNLSLKSKGLTEIPADISKLVNLERLDLSGNKISTLTPVLFKMKKLKYLNLTGNLLRSLPPAIGDLNNLEELEIAFNEIAALPKEIARLTKLTRIAAAKNNLHDLPEEMGSLQHLSILDFTYNHFTALPQVLCKLKNLKALDVSFNKQLGSYPAGIKNLQSLKIFGLKSTKISQAQVKELNTWLPYCTILL